MTVEEMMQRMSSEELTYWRALARREPIGTAALFRAAQNVCLAATAPYAKKDEPPSADAFMPDWWGDGRRRARRGARRREKVEALRQELEGRLRRQLEGRGDG